MFLNSRRSRSLTECNLVLTQFVSNSFGSIIHFRSNSSVFNVAQKFSEFHVYIYTEQVSSVFDKEFHQKSLNYTKTS